MTQYIIMDDAAEIDIDTSGEGTLMLTDVSERGRKLLAQGVDARRVVEIGEARIENDAE